MRTTSRREAVSALAAASLAALPRVPGRRPLQDPDELLIRGGRVVNADGSRMADVRVRGERIVEVGERLHAGTGARVIDAAGRLVLPGGIDPHTHLAPPFADDLITGTAAALAGGVTTVGTFAFARRNESMTAALARVAETARTQAIGDVLLHGGAWPPTKESIAELPGLVTAGYPSIKVFMPMADFHDQLGPVVELLESAARAGTTVMMHCEDAVLLGAAVRRLTDQGRTSLASYAESRPVLAEEMATREAIYLAEFTGATIYVVHLSSARALAACREARAAGIRVHVETRPLYLHYTAERMTGPEGPLFIGQPPLRNMADVEALWAGLLDGTIDVLATDHAPWTRAQKLDPALTVSNLRPGVSDLQFMLPMYFAEGVGRRGMPLERFVATTSTNAARIFGLADRGVIREGAVADLVIWDPRLRRTVRAADDHSRADYSPHEGHEVTGWPVFTIRRGTVAAEGNRILAEPGSGRVTLRKPG